MTSLLDRPRRATTLSRWGVAAAVLLGLLASTASAETVSAVTDQPPVSIDGRSYLLAVDSERKTLLVRTDGTQAGTKVIQRLCIPPRCDGPAGLLALGDRIVVTTYGTRGAIFTSEPGGEELTRRFRSARSANRAMSAFVADGRLYVVRAENSAASRWTVWRADLTADRLRKVTRAQFGSITDIARSGDRLLIGAGGAGGKTTEALWSIRKGKATHLAPRGTGGPLLTATGDGRFYFGGRDAGGGNALWITDGTTAGTKRVSDFDAGTLGASITVITGSEGARYAMATAAGRSTIARLSGDQAPVIISQGEDLSIEPASEGRAIVRSLNAAPQFLNLTTGARTPAMSVPIGADAKFVGPNAIWVEDDWATLKWSDGTAVGTRVLRTFPLVNCYRSCNHPISRLDIVDGRAYIVDDARQLWSTDGTEAGTVQLTGRGTN